MEAKNLLFFALLILSLVGSSLGGVFHFEITGTSDNVLKKAKQLKIIVDGGSSFTSTSPVTKWYAGYRWPERFEVPMKKGQNIKFVLIGFNGENLSESNSMSWESVAEPTSYDNSIIFSNSAYGLADLHIYMIQNQGAECKCSTFNTV